MSAHHILQSLSLYSETGSLNQSWLLLITLPRTWITLAVAELIQTQSPALSRVKGAHYLLFSGE